MVAVITDLGGAMSRSHRKTCEVQEQCQNQRRGGEVRHRGKGGEGMKEGGKRDYAVVKHVGFQS